MNKTPFPENPSPEFHRVLNTNHHVDFCFQTGMSLEETIIHLSKIMEAKDTTMVDLLQTKPLSLLGTPNGEACFAGVGLKPHSF